MATSNFAFEVKVIRGLEHTHPESRDERNERGERGERKKQDIEVAHHLKRAALIRVNYFAVNVPEIDDRKTTEKT